MRYQITGKQIDIGEALQTHVQTELGSVLEKYSQRPTDATVIFSKAAHEYVCEAVVHGPARSLGSHDADPATQSANHPRCVRAFAHTIYYFIVPAPLRH